MKYIDKLRFLFIANKYKIIGSIILVGALWFIFGGSKKETTNLLVVRPSNFIKQVSVSGKVVATQNVELGFDQSGRVSNVFAKVGDMVMAGTVIASIENGDIKADILQKEAALLTAKANFQTVLKGTRQEQLVVTKSSVTSAELALVQANQALVNAIRDTYTKSDDAVRSKVDLFISNPKSENPKLQFTVSDPQLSIKIIYERLTMEKILTKWKADIETLNAKEDLSLAVLQAETNVTLVATFLNNVSSALNLAFAGTEVSQSTLDTYKSNISTARTAINSSITTLTTAITSQKSAISTLLTAQSNLNLELAGSTNEDIEAESAKVKSAEADVLSAQARLRKSQIIAPFKGVITRMDAKTGEVVSPGTSKISMISNDTFQIESYVPEVEIAFLKVGNEGVVTLDAYGDSVPFPVSVVSIDPAETVRDGVSTYKVILQFKLSDTRIKSGMTANITIITEEKPNVLQVPQGIVIEKNGKHFVFVMEGNEKVEREVVVGSVSSLGQSEIISGLENGETVVVSIKTE